MKFLHNPYAESNNTSMSDSNNDSDDSGIPLYHWVLVCSAFTVLIFSRWPTRHWVWSGLIGVSIACYFGTQGRRKRRKLALCSLVGGAVVLALIYWLAPHGAFWSYNGLKDIDDDSFVADLALGSGAVFAGGLLTQAWAILRMLVTGR